MSLSSVGGNDFTLGKENSTPQRSSRGGGGDDKQLLLRSGGSGGKGGGGASGAGGAGGSGKKKALSPSWLFNAALLSSPVDLGPLVTLSRDDPDAILQELGLLNKLVDKVLNADEAKASGKRMAKTTRLEALLILANCCRSDDEFATEHVQKVLGGVSEWFEAYLEKYEAPSGKAIGGSGGGSGGDSGGSGAVALGRGSAGGELGAGGAELHKAMLLLLARAYEYKLRTEDLLELTGGDRRLALECVIGILEDGEGEVTEVSRRNAPKDGQRGQWEQRVATIRHEKPLILHMCQLLLGFTQYSSL